MGLIEQAVFTSAQTDRLAGYQLVGQSPGISDEDAAALSAFGPSHDALLEPGPEPGSINFHALPSGAFCISRTTAAGWEYSGRGGQRIYTQSLVVPPVVLERFANNPFALLRAAMGCGAICVYDRVPERLAPFLLAGRAQPVDQGLLSRLAVHPGSEALAALVAAALETERLAVVGHQSGAALLAGLMSCLPPEVRTQFSFSTGLKYSSRRSLRLTAIPNDVATKNWMAHQAGVTVLDLTVAAPRRSAPDGWAQLVARVLAAGRVSFLAHELAKRHADLVPADLPALGLQLLEEFEAGALSTDHKADAITTDGAAISHEPAGDGGAAAPTPSNSTRPHAAHAALDKSAEATAVRPAGPSQHFETNTREAQAKLEYLDDLVFEAIAGQQRALEELQTAWPALRAQLGDDLLAESREQYLRYSLQVWEGCVAADGVRHASRAVQALDVLCLLFDEV